MVAGIEKIVLPLGPYRNLTTLIAAIFALHPQCVVLNHAAQRIFTKSSIDLFREPNGRKGDAFIRAAVRLLQGGKVGSFGGSILHGHAFDNEDLRAIYKKRYADNILKPSTRVLFWKESNIILNRFWKNDKLLNEIVKNYENVRFILPVRNPLACAYSNLNRRHWRYLVSAENRDFKNILAAILDIIHWCVEMDKKYLGRFLILWETDGLEFFLESICGFCEIDLDDRWKNDILEVAKINETNLESEDKSMYRDIVKERFSDLPEIREKLLLMN